MSSMDCRVKPPITLDDLRMLVYAEAAAQERCADPLVPGEDLVTVDVSQYDLPADYETCSLPWARDLSLLFVKRDGDELVFEPVWREEVPHVR